MSADLRAKSHSGGRGQCVKSYDLMSSDRFGDGVRIGGRDRCGENAVLGSHGGYRGQYLGRVATVCQVHTDELALGVLAFRSLLALSDRLVVAERVLLVPIASDSAVTPSRQSIEESVRVDLPSCRDDNVRFLSRFHRGTTNDV